MEEKRHYSRWITDPSKKTTISYSGTKEEANILDMSAGGMRVSFAKRLDEGAAVEGVFNVIDNVGPFFVKGKVSRVTAKGDKYETAIVFEKVKVITEGF